MDIKGLDRKSNTF